MKRKLLLADDSATIQKVIQLCFADEPFELEVAQTGQRASWLLRAWRPDILLADVLMPEIDGYELCKQAKQENRIPVILLVGTFEPFDFGRAEQAGYDAFLTKPFDTVHLIEIVKEWAARPTPVREEVGASERVHILEFQEQDFPPAPAVLEIEEFQLRPWAYQIVPQRELVLPPIPTPSAAAKPVSPGPTRDLSAEVAAAIERLLPHWTETIRAQLLEELKRLS